MLTQTRGMVPCNTLTLSAIPVAVSFQSPVEIPGVSNSEFLRLAANTKRKAQGQPELDPMEFFGFIVPKVGQMSIGRVHLPTQAFMSATQDLTFHPGHVQLNELKMDLSFLDRDVNAGFSVRIQHACPVE